MNKRIILGLGSVAAALAIGSAALVGGVGLTQQSEVTYMTDGPTYADFTDLTKASRAVAHVKVLSAGASYTIPFDNAAPVVGARPTGNPDKDKQGALTSTTPAGAAPKDLLKTDFSVQVLESVRGTGLRVGDRIVISQIGGTQTSRGPDGSTTNVIVANAEHDPLMQVGDEEMLFLNQDVASGKFFTTGGGAGRFKIATNGTLMAVDHDSPLARVANGKTTTFLTNAVQGVK